MNKANQHREQALRLEISAECFFRELVQMMGRRCDSQYLVRHNEHMEFYEFKHKQHIEAAEALEAGK